MKWITICLLLTYWYCFSSCEAQKEFGNNLLQSIGNINMPGVSGRIDHMDINLKEQIVYVAALGNNTLEVIDLKERKVTHSINGLSEPQGVGYIPQTREILVANGGNGDCNFYNANSFEKIASVQLGEDADDVRVDSAENRIYVGYGSGGIAIIDAVTHKQVADIKLPGHPESFQIDKQLHLLFVNVPDAGIIGVIDLSTLKPTAQWINNNAKANFPMALNTQPHQVIVGYRHPAMIKIFNAQTAKEAGSMPMAGDADDVYFDAEKKSIYVSSGDGYINIFKQQATDNYEQVANIATRDGARTSLFIPQMQLFIVAARAVSGKEAALLIYHTEK